MANQSCVEQCMDCFDSAANADVMWQTIPVPWFGKIESAQVATVGLNPSWTEFVTSELIWRDAEMRLPADPCLTRNNPQHDTAPHDCDDNA